MAKAGGNILFRSTTHAQPTCKGMPQGVPVHILALILNSNRLIVRFLLQSSFLQGRYIHSMVEVFGVYGCPLIWLGKTHWESFHEVIPYKIPMAWKISGTRPNGIYVASMGSAKKPFRFILRHVSGVLMGTAISHC